MNGWENIEKNDQINVQFFLQQLFVFRNNSIQQQFDIIYWTYILVTNAFHHLQPIHYWWIGDDETLHLLLLMWPCILIAMWLLQCFSLPYQLATFMQWSNIWVFNLPAKGRNSKEYKDSTGRCYHKSMWLVHVHMC